MLLVHGVQLREITRIGVQTVYAHGAHYALHCHGRGIWASYLSESTAMNLATFFRAGDFVPADINVMETTQCDLTSSCSK